MCVRKNTRTKERGFFSFPDHDVNNLSVQLEHNCIPATCCCDDVCSVQALSGIEIAGFRKFQQTSCITHKVFIAVEVCTQDDELHDLGSPSAAPLFFQALWGSLMTTNQATVCVTQ